MSREWYPDYRPNCDELIKKMKNSNFASSTTKGDLFNRSFFRDFIEDEFDLANEFDSGLCDKESNSLIDTSELQVVSPKFEKFYNKFIEEINSEKDLFPIFKEYSEFSVKYKTKMLSQRTLDSDNLDYILSQIKKSLIKDSGFVIKELGLLLQDCVSCSLSITKSIDRNLRAIFESISSENLHFFIDNVLLLLLAKYDDSNTSLREWIYSIIASITDDSASVLLFNSYVKNVKATESSMALLEILIKPKIVLEEETRQLVLFEFLLEGDEKFIKSNSKFGKSVQFFIKKLPGSINSCVYQKIEELALIHSSFLKKPILSELKKKKCF